MFFAERKIFISYQH